MKKRPMMGLFKKEKTSAFEDTETIVSKEREREDCTLAER